VREQAQELVSAKKFDSAVKLLQERGGKWQRKYGAKSWPMAEVASQLAEAYLACGSACGKEAGAAELFEKSAAVRGEVFGEGSPQYAEALERAADALVQVGQHKRAVPHYRKLVRSVASNLGETHAATKNLRAKLGSCLLQAKRYGRAAAVLAKLLRQAPPAEQEARAELQLATALAHLGRQGEALQHAQRARELNGRLFGKADVRYARTLNGVAGLLERLGRDQEALDLMQEASDIVTKALGEEDPTAVSARKNVDGLRSFVASKAKEAPEAARPATPQVQ